MGLTPGHLSNAINRQAKKAESPLGSTNEVHSLLANRASEWQRFCEAEWKEVQRRLQQCASSPDCAFGVEGSNVDTPCIYPVIYNWVNRWGVLVIPE